jgi:hypothetical protein
MVGRVTSSPLIRTPLTADLLRGALEAEHVELRALASRFAFRGLPARPAGVFDLVVDGELVGHASLESANLTVMDPATGAVETTAGDVEALHFDLPRAGQGARMVETGCPTTNPSSWSSW